MLKFSVQTPGRKLLQQVEVVEVQAPGVKGMLQILPEHADFVTLLETGVLKWRAPNAHEMQTASLSWGFLQIKDGLITVLADVSEFGNEIDKGRAQVAFEKAKKKLEEGGLDEADFERAQLKLQRALARLEIAN